MFEWISQNAVTIVTIAVLLVIAGLAAWSLIRDKKRGKASGGCTGNCATCRMGSCGKK